MDGEEIMQVESAQPEITKSADDILNELFTELGSKQFSESVVDFLGTPKKKKKHHKEKKEKIKKQKEKEKEPKKKKKKEHSSAKKRKKSSGDHEDKVEEPENEKHARKRKIPTLSKKGDKASEKSKTEGDIEDGEIVEKEKEPHDHHHREKSSRRHSREKDGKEHDRLEKVHSEHWIPDRSLDNKDRGHHRDGYRSENEYKSREHRKTGSPHSRRHSGSRHGSPPRSSRRDRSYSDRSPSSHYGHDRRGDSGYSSGRRSPFSSRIGDRRPDFRSRRFAPEHDTFRGRRVAPPYRPSRSRSRSRSRYPSDIIDKAKLLEIARRNATLLMKKGVLPTDIFSKDQIVAIKAGGKSVEELTAYCRRLARKERVDGEASDDNHGARSDDDGDSEHFIHHPFMVKERPMPQITLNIRNAIPLPVRTPQELAIENAVRKSQFPVSSGCQHRFKELEWKEVDGEEEKKKNTVTTVATVAPAPIEATAEPVEKPVALVDPSPPPPPPPAPTTADTGISVEEPVIPQVDIGSVISARLKAMRALKENPECEEAKRQLDDALQEMEHWAQAKALEPKFLTVSDLQSGPQAWAKRDQLKNAKQVASGMGMHLLQKMGWKPGEGLGKNKEGTTEPLALDVKTDKKGLMSQADLKIKGPQANVSMLYDLSGKHPVSALMELCTKRRWGPPVFELCFEHGPPHQKSFVFKVTVNGVEYQPCIATNNKKLAKANAAAFCLQSLGLLKPAATPPAPAETLQTVPGPSGTAEVAGMRLVPSHTLQTVPNNV